VLMVILGAGASYDSSPDYPPSHVLPARPPLANELFHQRYLRFRTEFPQFLGLLAELVPKPGRSIEDALQRLQHDGRTNPARVTQLTAIRYYLRSLLESTARDWLSVNGDHTTYNNLLEQIQNHREDEESVCLVTFNYDTLLESALRKQCGMSFDVVPDYVSHPQFKLFKLHGSTNWGRLVTSAPTRLGGTWKPEDVISSAHLFTISDQYATYDGYVGQLFPAIAIPVTEKQVFECPSDHVGQLRELIPQVTKVLTIGWRGTESHFLSLLHDHYGRSGHGPITVVTVAGTEEEAEQTLQNLRKTAMGIGEHVALAGFSDTIGDRKLDGFFAR